MFTRDNSVRGRKWKILALESVEWQCRCPRFFNQQKQCKTEKRCIGKPCALFLNTPNNWHMASTDVVYLLSVADISHINIRYSPLSISILQMNLLLPFQQHIINFFCSTKLMLLFFLTGEVLCRKTWST